MILVRCTCVYVTTYVCTHVGPPKREEEEDESFGLPAVIDTGMFNVKVRIQVTLYIHMCVNFVLLF